jgi:uncharacterized phage-associated protein
MHTETVTAGWDGVSDFYEDDEPLESVLALLDQPATVVTARPVSALDVAAEIKRRCTGIGRLKLLKLCYYGQAVHLLMTGRPLFPDRIEAWPGGPVVRSVWIDLQHGDGTAGDADTVAAHPTASVAVDQTLTKYREWSGAQLSELSHREEPWQAARHGLAPNAASTREITPEAILNYYRDLQQIPGEDPA